MYTRAMFTDLSIVDTDNVLSGGPFNQLGPSNNIDTMSCSLMSRSRSPLRPVPNTMSALVPTPDYFSTGGPRLVADWWVCCQCSQMVNPSLAPENRCPCCAHDKCNFCRKETVR